MVKHQKPTSVPVSKGSELPLPLKLTHFNTTNINKTEPLNYQVSTVPVYAGLTTKKTSIKLRFYWASSEREKCGQRPKQSTMLQSSSGSNFQEQSV